MNTIKFLKEQLAATQKREAEWKAEYETTKAFYDDEQRQLSAMRQECDRLRDALRSILPLAEAYLKSAPAHPDNAKLEDARALSAKEPNVHDKP